MPPVAILLYIGIGSAITLGVGYLAYKVSTAFSESVNGAGEEVDALILDEEDERELDVEKGGIESGGEGGIESGEVTANIDTLGVQHQNDNVGQSRTHQQSSGGFKSQVSVDSGIDDPPIHPDPPID